MNRLNLKSGIHDNFSTPVTAQPTKQNQSAVQRAPQQRRKSRDHESPRSFFAPVHYERGYAYPLLVWLHENGSNHQELRQVMPHVSVRNYVAASIRGTIASTADRRAYSWDDSDAGAIEAGELIDQCIEEAAERFNIHRGRVFIVGRGAGGTMALRVGLRHPELFAAAISFEGGLPRRDAPLRMVNRVRKLPLYIGYSELGVQYSPEQAAEDLRLVHAAGLKTHFAQFLGEEGLSTAMLAELDSWVMKQICPGEKVAAS